MLVSAMRKLPFDMFSIRSLPHFVEVGVVMAMAWVVAGWLTGGVQTAALSSDRMKRSEVAVPSVESIAAIPLFGEMAKEVVSGKPVLPVVTVLRLRLLGTMLAGAHSAAIVMPEAAGEQKLVFVGDVIQPGVLLKDVEAWAIKVDNHGRLERILMAKASPVTAPASVRTEDDIRHISRAVVDAKLNDLPALLTQARVIPHQMDGKPDGFLIQEIVPGSLYAQAGLKNGDVIRKVNGQPVTRPEQGIALFHSLKNANGIDLEIARNGTVHTAHFDIR